jgi:hypothetical protein
MYINHIAAQQAITTPSMKVIKLDLVLKNSMMTEHIYIGGVACLLNTVPEVIRGWSDLPMKTHL